MDLSPYLTGILAVILFTAFVKIATVLNIVRAGLGLDGLGFGIAVLAVTLALSLVAAAPEVRSLGGIDAFLSGAGPARISEFEKKMTPFLTRHADAGIVKRLTALSGGGAGAPNGEADGHGGVLVAAFLLTELRGAFELGLIVLIPLLVIDLLVVNLLMVLGISQLSHLVVALPLKILLFFAVDGWGLIAEKLVRTYTGG